MPEQDTKVRRFVARLRAILEEDWGIRAGRLFRRGVSAISDVNTEYLHLEEKATEAPDLAWRAVQGLAGEKHAKAIADYARAENEKIDLALKQRVLNDKARQEKATADKLEAEAALAKINELKARAELAKCLQEMNVAINVDSAGEIRVFRNKRLPSDFMPKIFTLDEKRTLGIIVDVSLSALAGLQTDLGEIQLTRWLRKVGDTVQADEPIF